MKSCAMTGVGPAEVLAPLDVDAPSLGSDSDVLVKIRAAGVNPIDTKIRSGRTMTPSAMPAILGCDGAGVVESIGAGVGRFKPGDEVYFSRCPFGAQHGTYAEFALVEERLLAPKPKTLSFAEAAAAPLVLITAWESLFDRARVKEHDQVLIHAGAGGVGHVAIQLANRVVASVATTVGSAEKADFVSGLGAEKPILYKDEDFVDSVLGWTDGVGADMTLDTVGGEVFERSCLATRVYGDLVTILQPPPEMNWGAARQRNLRISLELMLSPLLLGLEHAQRHQARILRECAGMFDAGELRIHVADVLPLADAAEAHRRIEAGSCTGKIVLAVD